MHVLTHINLTEVRKLRFLKVKSFTQGHTAADGQNLDLNPATKLLRTCC